MHNNYLKNLSLLTLLLATTPCLTSSTQEEPSARQRDHTAIIDHETETTTPALPEVAQATTKSIATFRKAIDIASRGKADMLKVFCYTTCIGSCMDNDHIEDYPYGLLGGLIVTGVTFVIDLVCSIQYLYQGYEEKQIRELVGNFLTTFSGELIALVPWYCVVTYGPKRSGQWMTVIGAVVGIVCMYLWTHVVNHFYLRKSNPTTSTEQSTTTDAPTSSTAEVSSEALTTTVGHEADTKNPSLPQEKQATTKSVATFHKAEGIAWHGKKYMLQALTLGIGLGCYVKISGKTPVNEPIPLSIVYCLFGVVSIVVVFFIDFAFSVQYLRRGYEEKQVKNLVGGLWTTIGSELIALALHYCYKKWGPTYRHFAMYVINFFLGSICICLWTPVVNHFYLRKSNPTTSTEPSTATDAPTSSIPEESPRTSELTQQVSRVAV